VARINRWPDEPRLASLHYDSMLSYFTEYNLYHFTFFPKSNKSVKAVIQHKQEHLSQRYHHHPTGIRLICYERQANDSQTPLTEGRITAFVPSDCDTAINHRQMSPFSPSGIK
jgi:hypothetical protein